MGGGVTISGTGAMSNHNSSQSPASQTFFKDNSTKNKSNSSLIGKKGWPQLKKKNNGSNNIVNINMNNSTSSGPAAVMASSNASSANNQNNMYVSPYSKNTTVK